MQPGGYSVPPGYPQPVPGYGYPAASPPQDGMAIASLIVGIAAFFGLCCYGIGGVILGVTALVLGRVSLGRIKAAGGMVGGAGLANAGWICGLVAAVLGGIIGLAYLAFFIFAIANGSSTNFTFPTPSE
jgi:hypothetical protein